MTEDDEAKLIELLSDRYWRLNNLYWIIDPYGKKVRFKMNWAQKALYHTLHYLNVVLKVRQLGISTFFELFILDWCLFNKDQSCGIVDKTEPDVKKKVAKIVFAWDNLDFRDESNPDDNPGIADLGRSLKLTLGKRRQNGDIDPVKKSDLELKFSNGSTIWGGISLRGGTVQVLHISELGAVAANEPKKAEEIRSGALNTVAPGQLILSESTHEGGKYGVHYDLCELAMQNAGRNVKELGNMQWAFHFFSWLDEERYRSDPGTITINNDEARYFSKLRENHGITLTDEQKAWYAHKSREQKENMFKEFPTVAEEAFDALVKGSIYGATISNLRTKGHITSLRPDKNAPLLTSWDIGGSDYTAIWLIQLVGREIWWLDWYENNREGAGHYGNQMREWEKQYGTAIAMHYLPHDATHKDRGSGKSYVQYLADAGIDRVTVVPRTRDIWIGINHLRDLLSQSVFNVDTCGQPREKDGKKLLSGIGCLEGYRTKEDKSGSTIQELPIHDATSHSSDAARTFAEAHMGGLVQGVSGMGPSGRKRRGVVKTGSRTGTSSAKRRRNRVLR